MQTWLRQLPAPPAADAAFDAERIYIPLTSGEVVALERSSGEISWTADAETTWPPIVSRDAVFVISGTRLREVDAATGVARGMLELPGIPSAPGSQHEGRILIPLEPGTIQSVREGRLEWARPTAAAAQSPVAANAGIGYVSLANARVAAFSLETGAVAWLSEPLLGTLGRPVPSGDRVLVGSSDNVAFALDATTGRVAWKLDTGGAVVGAVATSSRFVVAALDNIVRAVDRSTGNQRWKHVTKTRSVTAPVVYRNLVVLHGNRPTLIALDVLNGEERGAFQLPDELNDPLLQGAPVVFMPSESADAPAGTTAVIVLKNGVVLGIGSPPPEKPADAEPDDDAAEEPPSPR